MFERPHLTFACTRRVVVAALFACAVFSSGCVTLYQPQKAIHRPVVIQPAPTNFSGLKVMVRCNAHEDDLPPGDAANMCSSIVQDLVSQGAEAEAVVPMGRSFIEPEVFDGARPDLVLEVQSRIDHEYFYYLTIPVSCLTFTAAPIMSEWTYSQQVRIFGRDGSVLAEETFQERFVQYFGLGVWGVNWILDWFVREDDDALSGDAGSVDFTKDFYGQTRQLLFNAKVRSEILGLTAGPARTRPFTPAPEAPAAEGASGAQTPNAASPPPGALDDGASEGEGLPGIDAADLDDDDLQDLISPRRRRARDRSNDGDK